MDIVEYMASGILENYCMGFCTSDEIREVEQMAALHPEINAELQKIRSVFEEHILSTKVEPSSSVKKAVMDAVYRQQAETDKKYFPFIHSDISKEEILDWVASADLSRPEQPDADMLIKDLTSSSHITNFVVWAKTGHESEMHTDFIEYLYIIDGGCTMYFENSPVSYGKNDIIEILPGVTHYAEVTSVLPMMAVVQRQSLV